MTRRWSWVLSVALAGLVVPATMAQAKDEENENENENENETKVPMDKIPAPARAALMREAAGAPILDTFEKTENGQTVYEAHVQKGSELLGITVDANGKVLE